ncbi:MAG: helix-turn-helix domain-containing protein [Eubacterium sp.]|nr:helix-turn-helix domain-containing protein [Eubacterium sp.]
MNQEKIGSFIAAARKEKNLTQAQLAEKLGVSNKTVSRWETGKNMPDYAILEELTTELGITVYELIRGEKIIKEDIIREYDHNLVSVLKEYKRMKKAKNILLTLLLLLAGITAWLACMLLLTQGLPYVLSTSAQIEINSDIARYHDYIGDNALDKYRNKWDMDESIFPEQITSDMNVTDYKMVYYDPWDSQYLSYLVVDYNDTAWNAELERLKNYPSTEYIGYYGVSGFHAYELLAIYADGYHGFVYALADRNSQRIIYVELIFCNYFMDIDYEEYIPAGYLPDGFDAAPGNAYRQEKSE